MKAKIKIICTLALIFSKVYSQDIAPVSQKQIDRFATVLSQIQYYYLEPTKYDKLFDNAIRGMLTGLDPHSDYLSPSDMADLRTSTEGEYAGIGVEIIPENGLIKIISPFDDTPAYKAGLLAGDIIFKINDTFVKDISTDEAIKLIKGKPGTSLTISVVRNGNDKPIKFDLQREIISLKTVKYKVYNNNIGYLRIAMFNDVTAPESKAAIQNMIKENNITGLIVDLRNNPGGTLDSAVDTTDLFLDKRNAISNGLIVSIEGRTKMDTFSSYATNGSLVQNMPLVVLINNGSASASEIFAGALQDNNRAIIFGTQSFGKGSVQSIIPIDYESAIKITTALYFTPAGKSIQARGIAPDVFAPIQSFPENSINSDFHSYTEENLSGHIKNILGKEESSNPRNDFELAENDFQLYQAINLISGVVSTMPKVAQSN